MYFTYIKKHQYITTTQNYMATVAKILF